MPTSIDQQELLTLREDCEPLLALDQQVQEAMRDVVAEIQARADQMRGIIWTSPAGKIAQNSSALAAKATQASAEITEKLQSLLKVLSEKPKEVL